MKLKDGVASEDLEAVVRLEARASELRSRLQRSEIVCANISSVLDNFEQRLSSMESSLLPIQARTKSLRRAHVNVDSALKVTQEVLTHYDVSRQLESELTGPMPDGEDGRKRFLDGIDKLQSAVDFLHGKEQKSADSAYKHSKEVLDKALATCLGEFQKQINAFGTVLGEIETALASEGGDTPNYVQTMKVVRRTISTHYNQRAALCRDRLCKLAATLSRSHAGHISNIFIESRRMCFESVLGKTEGGVMNKETVLSSTTWESLEKIGMMWGKKMQLVDSMMAEERKLIREMFGDKVNENLTLLKCVSLSLDNLFAFASEVAKMQHNANKVFIVLDMHNSLVNSLDGLHEQFVELDSEDFMSKLTALVKAFGTSTRATFDDLQSAIQQDTERQNPVDGSVHPLSSFVVNILRRLFEYPNALQMLFLDHDKSADLNHIMGLRKSATDDREKKKASEQKAVAKRKLAVALMNTIIVLQETLEQRAPLYKIPGQASFFLMNNANYLLKSIERLDLSKILGKNWKTRQEQFTSDYIQDYLTYSWGPLVKAMEETSGSPTVSAGRTHRPKRVKDTMKLINNSLREHHFVQRKWLAPDVKLRERLVDEIGKYFLAPYIPVLELATETSRDGKYTIFDRKSFLAYLNDFFCGRPD